MECGGDGAASASMQRSAWRSGAGLLARRSGAGLLVRRGRSGAGEDAAERALASAQRRRARAPPLLLFFLAGASPARGRGGGGSPARGDAGGQVARALLLRLGGDFGGAAAPRWDPAVHSLRSIGAAVRCDMVVLLAGDGAPLPRAEAVVLLAGHEAASSTVAAHRSRAVVVIGKQRERLLLRRRAAAALHPASTQPPAFSAEFSRRTKDECGTHSSFTVGPLFLEIWRTRSSIAEELAV